jgi:enoyl-CoA hydratase
MSTTNFETILIEKTDGLAVVQINRPKALNALNQTVIKELYDCMITLNMDQETAVIILTGAGEKAFVAGADISEFPKMGPDEARAFALLGQQVFSYIEKMKKPVIAAVNGFALGGGCELAMACDLRVASTKAKFGQPEVSLGITAGFGGTQRLPRLVGAGRAKELLMTGDMINAEEAYRIGLANKVVEPESLLDAAKEIAGKIMKQAPLAVSYSKEAVNQGMNMDLDSACAKEADVFALCFSSEDQKEGASAFLEKRKAAFKGK